jgi:hypothetical protein
LEDEGICEEMGSECVLGKLAWGGGCGLDSTGSGQGTVAGCYECGNEPSGSCATELVSYLAYFQFSLLYLTSHMCSENVYNKRVKHLIFDLSTCN